MDGSLFAKSACCKQLFESIAIFFVFTSYFLNENWSMICPIQKHLSWEVSHPVCIPCLIYSWFHSDFSSLEQSLLYRELLTSSTLLFLSKRLYHSHWPYRHLDGISIFVSPFSSSFNFGPCFIKDNWTSGRFVCDLHHSAIESNSLHANWGFLQFVGNILFVFWVLCSQVRCPPTVIFLLQFLTNRPLNTLTMHRNTILPTRISVPLLECTSHRDSSSMDINVVVCHHKSRWMSPPLHWLSPRRISYHGSWSRVLLSSFLRLWFRGKPVPGEEKAMDLTFCCRRMQ